MQRSAAMAAVLGLAATAAAGKALLWNHQNAKDFQTGQLSRAAVTSDGRVQLARELAPLADAKVAQVWSAAADKSGTLFLATGGPGALLKVDPKGTVATLYRNDKEHLFALAVAGDGTVYAGVSPGGAILRIKPGGKPEKLVDTQERYIWGLAVDSAGRLFAATGNQGKLLRIEPDGRSAVVYQAKQPHLLALVLAPSGVAYVGTDTDGLVVRVQPDGKAFVLHDASQAEVRTLLLTDEGTLFAGTGSVERPALPSGAPMRPMPDSGPGTPGSPTNRPPISDDELKAAKTSAEKGQQPKTATASPPGSRFRGPTPSASTATGENSVYRIRSDGAVDEVFRAKAIVLSLAAHEGRLLVGTGQEGRLYEVDPDTGEHGEIARLEHGQISAVVSLPTGGHLLATGTPGKLYRASGRFAASGSFLSDVLDAKMPARWGQAVAVVDAPPGTRTDVRARTGNGAKPDATWSDWSNDAARLPVGRFFQYQIGLYSAEGKATPQLRQFTLYYATVNRAPEIEAIEVPNLQSSTVTSATTKVGIKWKASDPNGDNLVYRLEVKKDGWPGWLVLEEDLARADYEWDPGSFPEGLYQVRVTASDKKANREAETLTALKMSDPFVLDRQAPAVRIEGQQQVGKRVEVRTSAVDSRARLVSADFAVDGKDWTPIFANDGVFDGPNEQATFLTAELAPGTHVLVVRYRDAAGHVGVADALLTVK